MFLTLNHICPNINIYIYIYNKIFEIEKKSSVRCSHVETENENEIFEDTHIQAGIPQP